MLGGIKKYPYLCSAKKERDGLCHQRTKTLAGHRALSEFAKKETLRIVPQQFLTIKRDTVQLTYPQPQGHESLRLISVVSLIICPSCNHFVCSHERVPSTRTT